MVVDPDPGEIYSKRKERISQLPKDAVPSSVNTISERWLGKVARKNAAIHESSRAPIDCFL